MIKYILKNKPLLMVTMIIFSPLLILYLFVYGPIVCAIGGFVWGVQKAYRFLLSNKIGCQNELFFLVLRAFFVIYIFFFICSLSFVACIFVGPFRAYGKIVRIKQYLVEGTLLKYKKVKVGLKPLVLVVEDEIDLADYVSGKILSAGKYATTIAYNGKEALRILEKNERFLGIAENRVGCIVLDIKMPEMNGIQFLKELRKREGALMFKDSGAFQQIPVIILSAYEDVEKITDVTHPKLGKAARYIMKPEKPEHYEELLSAIDSVFSGKDRDMVTNAYLSGNYRMQELQEE